MTERNRPSVTRARTAGRLSGAVFWLTLQSATIWVAFGSAPVWLEGNIGLLLWCAVIGSLAVLGMKFVLRSADGPFRRYAPQQYALFLVHVLREDPIRFLIFLAFLAALYVDGRPVLLGLNGLNFVLAFVLRAQPKSQAKQIP